MRLMYSSTFVGHDMSAVGRNGGQPNPPLMTHTGHPTFLAAEMQPVGQHRAVALETKSQP
jgi:hypothetical protein